MDREPTSKPILAKDIQAKSIERRTLLGRFGVAAGAVQGQTEPIALTLTPDGAELNVTMDFAQGMFVMTGRGAK